MPPDPLAPEDLTCRCSPEDIQRASDPAGGAPRLPGQERGIAAVEFGLGLKRPYFNITVSGVSRSGKSTLVEQMAQARAQHEPAGPDICVVPNFDAPHRPGVLYLSAGSGAQVNRHIDELLQSLDKQIPDLLEQPSVKAELQQINEGYRERIQAQTRRVEEVAEAHGIFLQGAQQGTTLTPLKDGRPLREEDYASLSREEREDIERRRREVMARMGEVHPQIMELEKERREALEAHVERAIRQLVHGHVVRIKQYVEERSGLQVYLDALEEAIVSRRHLFVASEGGDGQGEAQREAARQQLARSVKLNVIVDRAGAAGAPVVVEDNPTYSNLVGGADFVEERGVVRTDFSQIRAGSLLQANGGYLVLQAGDLLQYPAAYAALKRALRTGKVTLRDQFAEWGLRSGSHLEPEPVHFQTKVVLVGEERTVQMLHSLDDEFAGLFKIHADFSATVVRTPEVLQEMVAYLEFHAARLGLLPVTEAAVARVVEEASRRVAHQNRLSAQVNELMDTLIEGDLLARQAGETQLDAHRVGEAVDGRHQRHGKIEEAVKREISEGTILLDFEGSRVGQVNALAVYQVGRVAFGVPTRITAQAYAGRQGIINVEREADLAGRIHNKGMLILNGYLGRLFARRHPLALSVSICFEQNYGGIDGDSATMAEFFATVSAIAQVPLRQSIAVTGSMSQQGEVQPIGGVNEKITGFYEFSKQHGFPEGAGVIIPAVNRVNLLLPEEVIADVEAGRFHVYPVHRVEEGLELLTGLTAGAVEGDGPYPEGSVYARTMATLERFVPPEHKGGGSPHDPPGPMPV